MNSSATFHGELTPSECEIYVFLGGRLDQSTTEAYTVLLFITVITIITCPITTFLNALVMFAVKTKPRLKTMSNVALSCLATSDGMMGVIGQPLFIAWIITVLHGDTSSSINTCVVTQLGRNSIRILGLASIFLLALIHAERYIAIKHSLEYIAMVTKARILCTSAFAWIATLMLTLPLVIIHSYTYLIVSNIAASLCIVIIIFCQVVLNFETRLHEREIAAQQVSVEARQRFLKEKKAFKVTSTVLLTLITTYSPIMVVRILLAKSPIDSLNAKYIAFYTATFLLILNSLLNPVIYCVRLRQFRVGFIEVVFKKSNAQAEEIEMQVFGTLDACDQHEEGQQRAGDQNNEQRNSNNTGNKNNNNNSNDSDNNNNNNREDNNNHNNDVDDDNNSNSDKNIDHYNSNDNSNSIIDNNSDNSDNNIDDDNNDDDRDNNKSSNNSNSSSNNNDNDNTNKDSSNNSDGNSYENNNDDNNKTNNDNGFENINDDNNKTNNE